MFGFFRKKKKTEPKKSVGPVNGGITYDEKLISQFTGEHQELLSLFGDMVEAAEAENWAKVQKTLKVFTTILRGHLLTENLKLYVYLTNNLKSDPESLSIIREFRQEMMQIGRAVNQFVTHYGALKWTEGMKTEFLPELHGIGEVLVKRIQHEEQVLYPLYLPEQSYAA